MLQFCADNQITASMCRSSFEKTLYKDFLTHRHRQVRYEWATYHICSTCDVLSFFQMSSNMSRLHSQACQGGTKTWWEAEITGHNRLGLVTVKGGNSLRYTDRPAPKGWDPERPLEQLAMISFGWTTTLDHTSQLLSRISNIDWGSAMCGTSKRFHYEPVVSSKGVFVNVM